MIYGVKVGLELQKSHVLDSIPMIKMVCEVKRWSKGVILVLKLEFRKCRE